MSFTKDLDAFLAKAQANMDAVLQGTAAEVGKRLVERTPVESGAARGNWTVGINAPNVVETGRTDPGGSETVAAIAEAAKAARDGDSVYITNTSSYIAQLEDGSSTQAPNGMVSVTASEGAAIVEAVARRVAGGGGQ